jgi:biotin carboxyl carrier protein
MKKYKVKVEDKDYEVSIEDVSNGIFKVCLGEKTSEVRVKELFKVAEEKAIPEEKPPKKLAEERERVSRPAPEAREVIEAEGTLLKAEMSGTILSILKHEGDRISKGDIILKLEAMKMENDIVSPVSGVIKQIKFAEGVNVNSGEVIAIIGSE